MEIQTGLEWSLGAVPAAEYKTLLVQVFYSSEAEAVYYFILYSFNRTNLYNTNTLWIRHIFPLFLLCLLACSTVVVTAPAEFFFYPR